jgi:sortase A
MAGKKSNSPSLKDFKKVNYRRLFGNLLILASFILLYMVYSPIIKLYLPNANAQNVEQSESYSISIPKINAYAPIIDQVDPWNETEYKQALKKGVALAKGFSQPGEDGTIYIFAHSSASPWELTSYNTVFFRLGELSKNDQIIIKKDGRGYRYSVTETKTVWPSEVKSLTENSGNTLILQTCTPIGTSLKRLLVFAQPV